MYKVIFLFCLILILNKIKGQDIPQSLENRLKLIGMTFTPPQQYTIAHFEDSFGEYACEDENCPVRKLKVVDAKLTHQDGQCEILIYVSGADQVRYGSPQAKNDPHIKHPQFFSYNRIKSDFMYGERYKAASKQDTEDLEMMLTHYPQDSAKVIFNADYMLCYPFNMEGKKCQDKFTCARAIVAGKGGLDIFVYFVFTDKSIKDFDKYLAEFKQALWFKK